MKSKKLRKIQKRKIKEECWNLDDAFYNWLNERLPIYLKDAGNVVDLEYHKFTIDGVEYTQRQVIKMMIDDLSYLIDGNSFSDEYNEKMKHLLTCWMEVCPAMWW